MKTQRSNQTAAPTRMMRASLLGLVALVFTLGPMSRAAHGEPAKTKPIEVKWSATVDGKAAGQETLKTVHSSTGRVFASGTVEPRAKDGIRLITHQQRDPGGIFKKYRREEKVRLGKGIFAFRKNKSCDRIVGLNQSLEALELAPIGTGPVWDRRAWHTLALWRTSLTGTEALEMTFLDISSRERKQVVATPASARDITTPKKERVSLEMWTLKGLSSGDVTTGWHPDAGLVFISDGSRELMQGGFTWEPPPPPPEPEPEPEPALETEEAAPSVAPAGDKPVEGAPEPTPEAPAEDAKPKPTPEAEGSTP